MREVNVAIADDNERILDMLGEIIEQDHLTCRRFLKNYK